MVVSFRLPPSRPRSDKATYDPRRVPSEVGGGQVRTPPEPPRVPVAAMKATANMVTSSKPVSPGRLVKLCKKYGSTDTSGVVGAKGGLLGFSVKRVIL